MEGLGVSFFPCLQQFKEAVTVLLSLEERASNTGASKR